MGQEIVEMAEKGPCSGSRFPTDQIRSTRTCGQPAKTPSSRTRIRTRNPNEAAVGVVLEMVKLLEAMEKFKKSLLLPL